MPENRSWPQLMKNWSPRPRELEDIGLENSPQYNLDEDVTQNGETLPKLTEELEPIQEVADHYIGYIMETIWQEAM